MVFNIYIYTHIYIWFMSISIDHCRNLEVYKWCRSILPWRPFDGKLGPPHAAATGGGREAHGHRGRNLPRKRRESGALPGRSQGPTTRGVRRPVGRWLSGSVAQGAPNEIGAWAVGTRHREISGNGETKSPVERKITGESTLEELFSDMSAGRWI